MYLKLSFIHAIFRINDEKMKLKTVVEETPSHIVLTRTTNPLAVVMPTPNKIVGIKCK